MNERHEACYQLLTLAHPRLCDQICAKYNLDSILHSDRRVTSVTRHSSGNKLKIDYTDYNSTSMMDKIYHFQFSLLLSILCPNPLYSLAHVLGQELTWLVKNNAHNHRGYSCSEIGLPESEIFLLLCWKQFVRNVDVCYAELKIF